MCPYNGHFTKVDARFIGAPASACFTPYQRLAGCHSHFRMQSLPWEAGPASRLFPANKRHRVLKVLNKEEMGIAQNSQPRGRVALSRVQSMSDALVRDPSPVLSLYSALMSPEAGPPGDCRKAARDDWTICFLVCTHQRGQRDLFPSRMNLFLQCDWPASDRCPPLGG